MKITNYGWSIRLVGCAAVDLALARCFSLYFLLDDPIKDHLEPRGLVLDAGPPRLRPPPPLKAVRGRSVLPIPDPQWRRGCLGHTEPPFVGVTG